MCGMVLDQVLREPGTKTQLAWRRYACSTPAGEALFGEFPGYGREVPPDLVVRQKFRPMWYSHGVSDYLRSGEGTWLLRAMTKEWMVEQFKQSVAVDAHGSSEQNNYRDELGKKVAEKWPKGTDFSHIEWAGTELAPAPGMRATADAWVAALAAGRAISEEDNLAAMGLGGREAALMGGYDNLIRTAPPEKLARLRPLRAGPTEHTCTSADPNVKACLAVHARGHEAFNMSVGGNAARNITVVAAPHGAGVSRICRRFRQGTAVRYDRLASALVGQDAYHRPTGQAGVDMMVVKATAAIVAARLASGYRSSVRTLFTHEHPETIVQELQRQGITARWLIYKPPEPQRDATIAARMVAPALRRYMQNCCVALYRAEGYADTLRSEEAVVQLVLQCK
jgi:hypothetical protein